MFRLQLASRERDIDALPRLCHKHRLGAVTCEPRPPKRLRSRCCHPRAGVGRDPRNRISRLAREPRSGGADALSAFWLAAAPERARIASSYHLCRLEDPAGKSWRTPLT